ncbi:hypothetical protein DSM3645_12051 [Blastopirellula marina DSM 3645]|uniref:Uncharacterized protein n=1 Tax=Blastopirellula marina DSM 3645 TaxID=314230 RepID=A3ZRI0_9BACT|nr:hypothetical protein DSM3645_12051 [Blastopirellula marina DSM 3645]
MTNVEAPMHNATNDFVFRASFDI